MVIINFILVIIAIVILIKAAVTNTTRGLDMDWKMKLSEVTIALLLLPVYGGIPMYLVVWLNKQPELKDLSGGIAFLVGAGLYYLYSIWRFNTVTKKLQQHETDYFNSLHGNTKS